MKPEMAHEILTTIAMFVVGPYVLGMTVAVVIGLLWWAWRWLRSFPPSHSKRTCAPRGR